MLLDVNGLIDLVFSMLLDVNGIIDLVLSECLSKPCWARYQCWLRFWMDGELQSWLMLCKVPGPFSLVRRGSKIVSQRSKDYLVNVSEVRLAWSRNRAWSAKISCHVKLFCWSYLIRQLFHVQAANYLLQFPWYLPCNNYILNFVQPDTNHLASFLDHLHLYAHCYITMVSLWFLLMMLTTSLVYFPVKVLYILSLTKKTKCLFLFTRRSTNFCDNVYFGPFSFLLRSGTHNG
jgi:hypothetical protein